MKKIFAIFLTICMVFSLTACGGGGGEGGDAPAPTDTDTVAVGAVVIAADGISEDAIYDYVSAIFENTDTLAQQHGKGAELDLDYAASITDVPYHPGAAKYFAEKGYDVPVKEGAGDGSINSKSLTFGTGGDTGTYYAFGSVLSQYVSNNTDVSVTAVTSGGSKANIEDLMAGDVQLGFVQTDVMSYAYSGTNLFTEKLDGFSVVAALYMEQVQIVTLDPAIASVADLEGKTVSIGAVGSGVYFNAIDCLNAYGLTEEDINPVYQAFGDSTESLQDGKIDAAFIVAGAPTNAITTLATSNTVYLVGFDKEHIDALIEISPYYAPNTIPASTYYTAAE